MRVKISWVFSYKLFNDPCFKQLQIKQIIQRAYNLFLPNRGLNDIYINNCKNYTFGPLQ
jgi:hypothetical protein